MAMMCGCRGAAPKGPPGPVALFPSGQGSHWSYSDTTDGAATKSEAQIVSSKVEGDQRVVAVRWTANGKPIQDEEYRISDREVARSRSGPGASETSNPPLPILRLPLNVGDRWTWTGKMSAGGRGNLPASAVIHVADREKITTIAGTFDAYRVGMSFEIENPQIVNAKQTNRATIWYAPGVGIVKQYVDQTTPEGETRESSRTLTKFQIKP